MIPENEMNLADPNTLIRIAVEKESGSYLIKLHDMSGEITKKQMKYAINTFIKKIPPNELYSMTPRKLNKLFKEAMIVELVTEWLEAK